MGELEKGNKAGAESLAQRAFKYWKLRRGVDGLKWQEMGCLHFALAVHGYTGHTADARKYFLKAEDRFKTDDYRKYLGHLPSEGSAETTLEHLELSSPFPQGSNVIYLGHLEYKEKDHT